MEYLDFVVEQKIEPLKEHEANIYEKVMIATTRAKDILEGKSPTENRLNEHKATSTAWFELQNKLIDENITIKKEQDNYSNLDDDDFEDNELEEEM